MRALYSSAPPSDWAYATSEGIVLGNGIPPDPPRNLTARGMFGFALLEWENPTNADLSHIEVWENDKDELMSATMVGQTRADNFTRMIPAGGARWYWVRAVNYTGQKSAYNSEAGTPCIIDPESAEAWITDFLEKNPWLQEALDELNTKIEPLEVEIADITRNLDEIKNNVIVDLEGRIKDNENRIFNNLEPGLDLVSAGVLRLADQADYVGDVFRWAGMEINPEEGTVVIRAVEDLKTETGYQFTNVEQRLDAQEADINLKATRVYVDELAASLISSITVAQEWKFEGSLNGWTGQNATLTAQPAGIKYAVTAANPSMTSPTISINGGVNNIIGLQLLQTAGEPDANIRIQYSTASHGFSDSYMKRVDLLGGISVTRSVQVNMYSLDAGGTDWKDSTITGIRFLIGNTIGAEYLVTLINIGQSSVDELMLEGLEMRITQAEADIDGANAAIALKADQTVVNGLQTRLNQAEIDIDGLNSKITLKADQTALNGVDARLKTAEIAIDAIDSGIIQQVLDYDLLQDQIDDLSAASLQNSVNEHEGQDERRVKLALAKEELNARIDDTNEAVATYRLQLLAIINENKAYYDNQITAVANDLSAEVGRRELLQAQVGQNTAAIQNEQKVRADADNATATQISTLQTKVNGNSAAIQTEQTARADADSALSAQIIQLRAVAGGNTSAINSERTVRANADSAITSSVNTLQSTVNGQAVSIQTNATAVNTLNGQMRASYTIKLDNNKYVSGIQLLNGGSGQSGFVVTADAFMVAKPGSTNPRQMLIYDSTVGQLVLNSLMVNRAAIVDASVNTLKIAGRSVTIPVGLTGYSYASWGRYHADKIGTYYPVYYSNTTNQVVLSVPNCEANQPVWVMLSCGITAVICTIGIRLVCGGVANGIYGEDSAWTALKNERRSGSYSCGFMVTPTGNGTLTVRFDWKISYTHDQKSDSYNYNHSSVNQFSLLALQCKR